jgi:hypothetical protein
MDFRFQRKSGRRAADIIAMTEFDPNRPSPIRSTKSIELINLKNLSHWG